MDALGTHLLLELEACHADILGDVKKIEETLVLAAKKSNATVVETRFHQFNPFGVSGVVVIAESHLTIHTWPEHSYAAVDIFTCGEALQPMVASDYLIRKFQSERSSIFELRRGPFSMKSHRIQEKHLTHGDEKPDVFRKVLQVVR